MLQLSLIRLISRFFSRRDTPHPKFPEPLIEYEGVMYTREQLAHVHSAARRDRYGPLPIFEGRPFVNVIRQIEYAGQDPTKINVPSDSFLTGHVTLIGPDNKPYEAIISFKSGQPYNAKEFNTNLKGDIGNKIPDGSKASSFVDDSIVVVEWYLTKFIPIKQP